MLATFADGAYITHGMFVLLVVPSTILALVGFYRSTPSLWHLHNISILIMAVGRVLTGRCPLVELEETLRTSAGDPMPYTGSYVNHLVSTLSGISLPGGTMLFVSSAIGVLSLAAILIHRPYPRVMNPVAIQPAVG
ncbi:MAG: DUF2784 family protein [Dehalococcoidia bacterium]